ncbi:MAG TPA: hypothetical protein VGS27_09670 [Candidatus Sulfotelmatobacter sp.]|nr:hypothetical protein [Candidatus Sulfotelmatobacter sp.]
MKWFSVAVLFVLGVALIGCGSNSSPSSVNGAWNATLVGGNQNTVLQFGTNLHSNADGSLTISSFSFNTNSPCFSSETERGSFSLGGNFSGNVTGKFGMTVQSLSPSGNTLTLSGSVNGNKIAGKWNLTGSSGCTGSGTFTMIKV